MEKKERKCIYCIYVDINNETCRNIKRGYWQDESVPHHDYELADSHGSREWAKRCPYFKNLRSNF
jgi:hypothetical protein